jgi:ABC-type transport system involved in multi-copper enzyme maturation permease subunit
VKAFAAVFAREIFERRFAFLVAFLGGFVPLIGSGLYGWSSPDAAEGRVLVALVGATALSAAFALLLGGAVIVGETKEKRISFYFSRPIPSAAIWAGKLLAAILVAFAAALLAFAPGWLSGTGPARSLWGFDATPGNTVLGALALSVVLVLGSHAAVTVARLRSPWVALDLILAPALVIFAAISLRSLLGNSSADDFDAGVKPVTAALAALAAAFFLALVLASFVQVAEGRTDARRAHGAFSVVLFGIFGTAVTLVGGYAWWCASAKATDLETVVGAVETAPRGPWLAAGGSLRAGLGSGSFVFDAVGGRSLRLHGGNVAFSQDGTRAAWGERRFGFFERKDTRLDLVVADLATGRAIATGLETGGWSGLALSPGGRRLAVRDGQTLAAYDVSDAANPKQLAVFPVPDGSRRFAFIDEDTIRLFPRFYNAANHKDIAPSALEITELSLFSKKSIATGRFGRETLPYLRMSADGRFFVGTRMLSENSTALTLRDGRTGALVATLSEDLRNPQARFLTGNRIAVAGIAEAQARLYFFEGEKGWGAPAHIVELGPAKQVALGGEIAPGRVAVGLGALQRNPPSSASKWAWRVALVDAATGAVSPGPDGLVPADRWGWWWNPVLPPAEAGAPWSSLFLDAEDRLVRLDPATGATTVLLGKGK